MPDREAPVSLAQHSFTSGEVAPGIYGRQDLAKYHTACSVMRNWFVDPKGGAGEPPGRGRGQLPQEARVRASPRSRGT